MYLIVFQICTYYEFAWYLAAVWNPTTSFCCWLLPGHVPWLSSIYWAQDVHEWWQKETHNQIPNQNKACFPICCQFVNYKIEVYESATKRTWSSQCWVLQLTIAMVWQNLMGIGCGVTDCLDWCDVGFAQKDGNLWDKLVHWHSTRRIILGEKWVKLALALWMCMWTVNLSHVLLRSSLMKVPECISHVTSNCMLKTQIEIWDLVNLTVTSHCMHTRK